MTESGPRLVRVHFDRFAKGGARRRCWAGARTGMTLLGARLPELRHLAQRGAIEMDAPLPPPGPRRASSQRVPRPAVPKRPRPCITCRGTFASEGAHHRMCDRCRQRAGGVSPLAPD